MPAMAEVTEIYSCKEGQQLKDGKLEISHDIADKRQAEVDARGRCNKDKTLKKVAYYRLNDEGDFRCFYTFVNEHAQSNAAKRDPEPRAKKKKAKKKKPKPTFFQRLFK
tara:strand:+ start:755 stop:1081 length:327 start_codon:yes stop_codon:yes gene_type:complete